MPKRVSCSFSSSLTHKGVCSRVSKRERALFYTVLRMHSRILYINAAERQHHTLPMQQSSQCLAVHAHRVNSAQLIILHVPSRRLLVPSQQDREQAGTETLSKGTLADCCQLATIHLPVLRVLGFGKSSMTAFMTVSMDTRVSCSSLVTGW